METGSFADNPWLRELRLSRLHRLRLIDFRAFVNMTSLRRLDLSQNRNLRYISRSAFVDVEALSSLVLTDSGLDTLELQVVDNLPSLKELSLKGNPLMCDCTLHVLLRHVQQDTAWNLSIDLALQDICPSLHDTTTPALYQTPQNFSTKFNGEKSQRKRKKQDRAG